MNRTTLTALALAVFASQTHAATVSLVPTSPIGGAIIGDVVSFDIVMDFTGEPTIGGGFDIVYTSESLQFTSLFRDPSIGEKDFSRDPTPGDGLLDDWVVAGFSPLPQQAVLGSVSFTVIAFPPWSVALTDARDGGVVPSLGGFWVSATDFISEIPVDYNAIAIVPLPAGLWLLVAGLATLPALRRR